jgi:hypothetical protein
MLPADMEGYIPPPAGAPCPFAYFQAGEFGEPGDQLRIFDFHVDFAVPANSTFTERVGSPLVVAAFDPICKGWVAIELRLPDRVCVIEVAKVIFA